MEGFWEERSPNGVGELYKREINASALLHHPSIYISISTLR